MEVYNTKYEKELAFLTFEGLFIFKFAFIVFSNRQQRQVPSIVSVANSDPVNNIIIEYERREQIIL